ncbi:MAG: tRNA (adenosine(37)-N6)-threonylcarbamoyltransferase complex ATPase subunit type 1 TsaE [Hydrogenophilus sp.]|nr:tRNA (adenosine(37)-N6)-threonylcarbamoyltransferase complex ATPase subunit type 1 TsaE [Hydrogenophilus sp.]
MFSAHRLLLLPTEAATAVLAAQIAPRLAAGGVFYLNGELGAGKTTFARALLAAFGYRGPVRSPTYTLIESYPECIPPVYHLDCYRLADPSEYLSAGLHEYHEPGTLLLVEWPQRAQPYLPSPHWTLTLTILGPNARRAHLTAHTPAAAEALTALSGDAFWITTSSAAL